MRYDELLDRAKWGTVSRQEIDEVVRELLDPRRKADRYTLLHILGKGGSPAFRAIVEPFLDWKEDPMLARLALQILCNYWDLTDQYIERVRQFVRGVAWDVDEDVRLAAISVAGEYLRTGSAPEILSDLLRILENSDERAIIREAAYTALARAVGRDWAELPPATRHFDLTRGIDPKVIQEVKDRIAQSEKSR